MKNLTREIRGTSETTVAVGDDVDERVDLPQVAGSQYVRVYLLAQIVYHLLTLVDDLVALVCHLVVVTAVYSLVFDIVALSVSRQI